ncbi:MAG TPA: hypothetical protein VFB04_18365 [Terriglobales bacterium]|nr:hypothetical protein [Terriglobales bacterium]
MRSRMSALVLSLMLVLGVAACNKQNQSQPAADNTSAQPSQMANSTPSTASNQPNPPAATSQVNPPATNPGGAMKEEAKTTPPPPPPPPPIEVPAGTNLVVRMGNTIDTKTANSGDTFTGTLARSVAVDGQVAIPSGAGVSGTVVSAKSPGRFKGAGELVVSLNSINVNGVPTNISTSSYAQTMKGKGKRTAVLTGGGAGAGALIGGLAGGGKGAVIGGLLGAGAGGAGSGLTGNKELQIPAESVVTFKLSNSITVKRSGRRSKAAASDDQGTPDQ